MPERTAFTVTVIPQSLTLGERAYSGPHTRPRVTWSRMLREALCPVSRTRTLSHREVMSGPEKTTDCIFITGEFNYWLKFLPAQYRSLSPFLLP